MSVLTLGIWRERWTTWAERRSECHRQDAAAASDQPGRAAISSRRGAAIHSTQ
jgi:hypothetical protein